VSPFVLIAGDRIVAAVLGILVVYGSARLLTPEAFSVLVIAESVRVGCLAVCDTAIGQAMVHRVGARGDSSAESVGAAALLKLLAWAAISLVCAALGLWAGLPGDWPRVLLATPVLVALSVFFSTAQQCFLADRRYRSLFTVDVLLLVLVIAVFAALERHGTSLDALTPLYAVAVARGAVGLVALGTRAGRRLAISRGEVQATLRFARSSLAGHVATYVNVRADPVLLGALSTPHAVGLWGLAAPSLYLFTVIGEAANQDLFPAVAQNAAGRNLGALVKRSFWTWTLPAVAAAIAIWLAPVGSWLPGAGSDAGAIDRVLALLAFAGVLLVVTRIGAAAHNGLGRPGRNARASWIGLAVKLSLGLVLIKRFDALGAAVASILVAATMAAVVWSLWRSDLRRRTLAEEPAA